MCLILAVTLLGRGIIVKAQLLADFGDAPDNTVDASMEAYPGVLARFPTLLNTGNAIILGNKGAHHLTVNEEWLSQTQTDTPSTTTENDANLIDKDLDDALVQIHCMTGIPGVVLNLCLLIVNAIHVGSIAPNVPRILNALVDVNHDGMWDSAMPFGTFPREHVIVNREILVPPGGARTVMSGPFVIAPPLAPMWVRVTVTRAPLNVAGWDGSAPPGGFQFGETEDHLVLPSLLPFLGPVKEPAWHFKLSVTPNPVPIPPGTFDISVTRVGPPPVNSPFVTAVTDVKLTVGLCKSVPIPGINIPAPPGLAGGIASDAGVINTPPGALPIGLAIGSSRTVPFVATYPPTPDSRVTTCRVNLAVDPDGEVVVYDYPYRSDMPIVFLEPAVQDGDADGVPDTLDRCPSTHEDLDGFQDEDGCPDSDNDGDGVLDESDICPIDIEDHDGIADDDGCPDPVSQVETTLGLSVGSETVNISTTPPGTVTLKIVLSPALPQRTIFVYQSKASPLGPWKLIGSGQTDSIGQYSVVWQPSEKGQYFIAAEFPGDMSHSPASATSRPKSLEVIPEFPDILPVVMAPAVLMFLMIFLPRRRLRLVGKRGRAKLVSNE